MAELIESPDGSLKITVIHSGENVVFSCKINLPPEKIQTIKDIVSVTGDPILYWELEESYVWEKI